METIAHNFTNDPILPFRFDHGDKAIRISVNRPEGTEPAVTLYIAGGGNFRFVTPEVAIQLAHDLLRCAFAASE